MTRLTSRQRKLVYLGGILILLIPIIALGMPASEELGSGGMLARLRQEHDLGESTIGDVDPSSATMNLVLLGLRGVAANVLWMQAQDQQETKNWGQLRSTVNSIVLLQPHFNQVWRFQGWNLAFNVSAQWDDVTDRYYWVKEGAKFTKLGTVRNKDYAELYWETGRVLGPKIGRADEWRYFRRYFVRDPDEATYKGGSDPELNPRIQDNYEVAGQWFTDANDAETRQPQHIMMRMLFRQYPARMALDQAHALQREGVFEEQTALAWDRGLTKWTQEFGRELYYVERATVVSSAGMYEQVLGRKLLAEPTGADVGIRLESTEADIAELAPMNKIDPALQAVWTDRYHKICNYNYWRTLARAEKEPGTVQAHHDIFEGKRLFREGKTTPRGEQGDQPSESGELLESGMDKLAGVFKSFPELTVEDNMIEEAMLAVMFWRYLHQLNDKPLPADFPLRDIWDAHQALLPQIETLFQRELRYVD